MPATVAIFGTLDAKGGEIEFLKGIIEESGCSAIVTDVGTLNPPTIQPDISREKVAAAATLEELAHRADRRSAVKPAWDVVSEEDRIAPSIPGTPWPIFTNYANFNSRIAHNSRRIVTYRVAELSNATVDTEQRRI